MTAIAEVQGRVAEIRARLAQVAPTPPAPGVYAAAAATTAAGAAAAGAAGVAGASAGSPAVPAAPDTTPAHASAAPVSATFAPVSGPAPAAALARATAGGTGGAWAEALPAAGRPHAAAIEAAAHAAGIQPGLLAALVERESGFDAGARSHAGAIGLGQLMPGTASGLGVDPHDPADNLRGAATYLREQLDRFGQVDLALAAYNAGPGRVASAGGVPRIAETERYVTNVLTTWERYR